MRLIMGIVKLPSGIYAARKKVPTRLAEAVAIVTDAKKPKVSWLKRSLGTRDKREANIVGKPVLIEFDRILAKAEARLAALPIRNHLSPQEIERIANYYYAQQLVEDDEIRLQSIGSEKPFQLIAKQLAKAAAVTDSQGILEFKEVGKEAVAALTFFDTKSPPPAYGLSEREMTKRGETIEWVLPHAQQALAKGDISILQDEEEIEDLLAVFKLQLDQNSQAYRDLGLAVLRKKVAALQALKKRQNGEPIETPHVPEPYSPEATKEGDTLSAAFEGWKKTKTRSEATTWEFSYAIRLFEELHGNVPIISITRRHVRQFREALQMVPSRRAGKLREATLPELIEWAKKHPDGQRIAPATINKLITGPGAIASWAYNNGVIKRTKSKRRQTGKEGSQLRSILAAPNTISRTSLNSDADRDFILFVFAGQT